MSRSSSPIARPRSRVLAIIWFLAAMLVLFSFENIWVDPWLRHKSRHMPTLVPEPLSGLWFLALLVMAIFCVLLVVAQILVALDRGIPLWKKMGTGSAAFLALLLCALWLRVTSGMASAPSLRHMGKTHSVTLTWVASHSVVTGYNVYRSTDPGGPYAKINSELVKVLTYRDQDVQSRTTYYYVARAVDAKDEESGDSNRIAATVP